MGLFFFTLLNQPDILKFSAAELVKTFKFCSRTVVAAASIQVSGAVEVIERASGPLPPNFSLFSTFADIAVRVGSPVQ